MPDVTANGITLFYERSGSPDHPAVLLIPGLGAQYHYWADGIVDPIVAAGFQVIRIDNRDAGHSHRFEGVRVSVGRVVETLLAGGRPDVPYLLDDMADDVVGLLDALDIEAAHVVGASLGGMVAQVVAIRHPSRVLTLTSLMSTTGDPTVGQATPAMNESLFTAPPSEREAAIQATVDYSRIAWADYFDEERARETAARNLDRGVYQQGTGRQLAALLASGDRTADLQALDVPTLVVHGEKDPLIDISGGVATAQAVPGAAFHVLRGAGHDLPPELHGELTDLLIDHFRATTA
ncbi:MAG TPA: alpha/beta fold hydrolase [Acidimicrobiia bacterium]|nr:alpha/beta fold hydrolase [Acidimicrobiia bacterium]